MIASGRHRKTRDWMLVWVLVIMLLPWAGILPLKALTSTPAALQPAPSHTIRPEPKIPYKPPQSSRKRTPANVITVAEGDSLWSLARKYCHNGNDYQKLASVNGIKSWVITPGEVIRIAC